MRGLLVAETIAADLVLRDPRSTLQKAIGIMTVAFALGVLRLWVGPIGLSRNSIAVAAIVAVVVAGLTFFRLPVWVRVGPTGVAFRAWFRSGQFRWTQIESFVIGNPSKPRFAYIILRSTARNAHGQAIKTPAFQTHSPTELVRILRAKQALFAGT